MSAQVSENRFRMGWRVARPYLVRHRRILGIGLFMLLLTNIFQVAIPWLLKIGVDTFPLLNEGGHARTTLAWVAAGILAAAAAQAVARVGSRWWLFRAGRDIEFEIRQAAYAQLLVLDPGYYASASRGDLVSRVSNDITNVRLLFGFGILNIANTVLAYAAALTIMLGISVPLTMAALIPLPLMFLFLRGYGRRLHRRFVDAQSSLGRLSGFLQEALGGYEVVKGFAQEQGFLKRFLDRNDDNYQANMRLAWTRSVMGPLTTFVGGFGIFIILGLGGWFTIRGSITLGEFVAFQGYLGMLVWPTLALGWLFNVLERGLASLMRVQEVMERPPVILDAPEARAHRPAGRISVRGLNLEMHDPARGQSFALENVSFELAPGQRLALVGRTGSGKSTLFRALLRLVELERGVVAYDGLDVHDIRLADLRAGIGYVSQEPFLFGTTLREALVVGLDTPSEDRQQAVIEAVALADEVAELPRGLDTRLGERGVSLSGGQRQRLALARLMLSDPAIVLLDDPMSALDFGTADQVRGALQRFVEGRTLIWATHRLQQMEWFDEVVLLRQGRIEARGRHAELLVEPEYRRLVERQKLLRRLEAES